MTVAINIAELILFEDEYVVVVHKPCGLMVEPDRNGHLNLLHLVRAYLRKSLPKEAEVYAQHIHRLDRPVSGIVLFAKQRAVLKNLSEQFAARTVKKYYQALTTQAPVQSSGVLEHWHRKEKKKAVLSPEEFPYAEKALLRYSIVQQSADRFLWNIELHTGKFHQIRAQLSDAGCPIMGDALYNSTQPYKPDAIALHACKLIFQHPVTHREMVIERTAEF